MKSPESFLLGGHRVEPAGGLVSGPAGSVHLAPKFMQVLLVLAGRPGQVVTREELLASVWQQSFVEEGVLTRAVAELRKALEDNPRSPWAIETIPKIGYRLLATPHPLPSPGPAAERSAEPVPETRRRPRWPLAAALLLVAAGVALGLSRRLEPGEPEPLLPLTSVPLNLHTGLYVDPALAPDASRLAYALAGVPERGLYTMAVPNGEPHRIAAPSVDGNPRAPAWSPDGQTVAFLRVRSDIGCTGVFLVPAHGGAERRLADCRPCRDGWTLDWSPDGRWLTLAGWHRARSGLYLLEVRSGRLQPLEMPPSPLFDFAPRFSPDGRRLAFRRGTGEEAEDLYVVPVTGGTPVRLTFDDRRIRGLAWTPDGAGLLYSSNRRSGRFELWQVPARGGTPRLLPLAGGGSPENPTFRRGRLVYERVEVKSELTPLDRIRGVLARRPWLASPGRDRQPAFSPDGRQVAFASDRSGSFEIWAAHLDGGAPRQLTRLGEPATGWPSWSPDGLRIAFTSNLHGHGDLFLTSTGGEVVERLTDDPTTDQAPTWSPDGRFLYYSSLREGKWQIRRLDLETRRSTLVLARGGPRCLLSSDGAWIYFPRAGMPGLWRAAPEHGDLAEPEPVVPELVPPDWGHWTLARREILFVRRSPQEGNLLVRLDPTTSLRQTLATFPTRLLPTGAGDVALAISPDGQTVLVTQSQMSVGLQLVSPATWPAPA